MTEEHGGKRPGAGRKPLSETEEVISISFKAPASVKRIAKELGDGNVSKGVRLLVDAGLEAMTARALEAIADLLENEADETTLLP